MCINGEWTMVLVGRICITCRVYLNTWELWKDNCESVRTLNDHDDFAYFTSVQHNVLSRQCHQ